MGDLPYKASGVILHSSVKKDGFLRQHVCAYFVSGNIWSVNAYKPPFKVEKTSLVCIQWFKYLNAYKRGLFHGF